MAGLGHDDNAIRRCRPSGVVTDVSIPLRKLQVILISQAKRMASPDLRRKTNSKVGYGDYQLLCIANWGLLSQNSNEDKEERVETVISIQSELENFAMTRWGQGH